MRTNISIIGIILGAIYIYMGIYLYSVAELVGVEIISWFLILDGIITLILGVMILVADSVEEEFDQIDD